MFATGHISLQKLNNQTKKRVFANGMRLDKGKTVKWKFTYKEITLIAGIAVAVIIAFTLFFRTPDGEQSLLINSLHWPSATSTGETLLQKILTEIMVK
jgi:hypothetical protein